MKSDVGDFPFNELVSSDVPNSATNLQFIWTKVPENVDFFSPCVKRRWLHWYKNEWSTFKTSTHAIQWATVRTVPGVINEAPARKNPSSRSVVVVVLVVDVFDVAVVVGDANLKMAHMWGHSPEAVSSLVNPIRGWKPIRWMPHWFGNFSAKDFVSITMIWIDSALKHKG